MQGKFEQLVAGSRPLDLEGVGISRIGPIETHQFRPTFRNKYISSSGLEFMWGPYYISV